MRILILIVTTVVVVVALAVGVLTQPARPPQPATAPYVTPEPPALVVAKELSHKAGYAEVRVLSAEVGKVPLDGGKKTATPYTAIRLAVTNHSRLRKLDYVSWYYAPLFGTPPQSRPRLTDEHGNDYRQNELLFGEVVEGRTADGPVHPGKTVEEVILFEVPVGQATVLFLELPLSDVGQRGRARFRIPASMLKRE